jgi:hypothetical protein
MPGLPWLDKQGWIASGGLNGGHQFTLGLTPLYVIKSTLGGGTPGGKVTLPVQLSSVSPLALPPEFKRFADIFNPQANCSLPPHRSMDISINLKEGAQPPFGGLYNLSSSEQQQLKLYIDENLKKVLVAFPLLVPPPQFSL